MQFIIEFFFYNVFLMTIGDDMMQYHVLVHRGRRQILQQDEQTEKGILQFLNSCHKI